ncbi:hypothetical protein [Lactococcus lactis]|uniref:hypothetical protein n=1 Tax=Lactococcus lactis TaxID=1358 RepID=UPI0021B155AB|nr:hypothetical protein [Lactococcus lactis]
MKTKYHVPNLGDVEGELPSDCIHCHKSVSFRVEGTTPIHKFSGGYFFSSVFLCPNCEKYSISEYQSAYQYSDYAIVKYHYQNEININLPLNIENVSPQFVELFKQSTVAEAQGLVDICGVGYRKSAEFLIKDYAISKTPDKTEDIQKAPLGSVIKTEFEAFPKIQNLAKATTWIGNDETHYIRKHNDKDLKDLKNFLLACATFIAADYEVDNALEFINK